MSSAYRSRDFIPHLTIGNQLNEEQLARIQRTVGEQTIYSQFEVEEMYLLVKGTRRYETKARWMLDKGQSVQYDAKAD